MTTAEREFLWCTPTWIGHCWRVTRMNTLEGVLEGRLLYTCKRCRHGFWIHDTAHRKARTP